MKKVLVTGHKGFIGQNLVLTLRLRILRQHGSLQLLIENIFLIPQEGLKEHMLLVQYKLWNFQKSLKVFLT